MYRDWELIDVLATQVSADFEALASAIEEARSHIARGDNEVTVEFLDRRVRPLLAAAISWRFSAT